MVIYPINGDGSNASTDYIGQLSKQEFEPIETFMQEEASSYQLSLTNPVNIVLGPVVNELPPDPPQSRNVFNIMWWSLKMRYWAHRVDTYKGPSSDIRMFVVYYDPAGRDRLSHSLGLEKGLIGVVNAFANKKQAATNNVVITHEMLHTVGATDKYDLQTGEPLYPTGYVDPDKNPLLPQDYAEIMAGVLPVAKGRWEMPRGLNQVTIGAETAREINWLPSQ